MRSVLNGISGAEDPAGAIKALEQNLGLTITIHDLAGVLRDGPDQAPLLSAYRSHRHPYCRLPASGGPHHHPCLDHCYHAVHQGLLSQGGAACHHCWRGACELAVPLWRQGAHVATLFAGVWRYGTRAPSDLPSEHQEAWTALSPFPRSRGRELASLVTVIGQGLLARCETHPTESGDERRRSIEAYLSRHLHEVLRLSDLAEALHVSTSRCGRVVHQLFGQTFPALLRSARLHRARHLLAETALPIRQIAERVGMPAEAHFHRAFRAATGLTPRAWRLASAASHGRRWPTESPGNHG